MYVCVCNAVTERQIAEAVAEGAKSVKDLNRLLGVGSECGSCVRSARECISQSHQSMHAASVQPSQIGAIPLHRVA